MHLKVHSHYQMLNPSISVERRGSDDMVDLLCFCLTKFSNSFCSCGGKGGGPGRLKPPERTRGVV